jgi:hypothetical protein
VSVTVPVPVPLVNWNDNDACQGTLIDGVRRCRHRATWLYGTRRFCGRHLHRTMCLEEALGQ